MDTASDINEGVQKSHYFSQSVQNKKIAKNAKLEK